MTEYKTNNALVRIHGNVKRETVEKSTIKFMKEIQKRKKGKK